MEAGAPAHHLIEGDGRVEVAEEDDVVDAGHVDAGAEEVDGGGYEVVGAAAPEVGQEVVAPTRGGALEGVGLNAYPFVLAGRAPLDV